MPDGPEERARKTIDALLKSAGWVIQDREGINVSTARGVAIREFPLNSGYGFADYLLNVDGAPAGVVEAKKEGETLTGYEVQSEKYSVGLPDVLKPYRKPLPFIYQSTGIETRFTNLLEPDARSRTVFAFHKPRAGVLPCELDAAAFDYEDLRRKRKLDGGTVWPGYVNVYGQVTVRNTSEPGTDKFHYVYQLACSGCGHVYGANRSDIRGRKCPRCQNGKPGIPLDGM